MTRTSSHARANTTAGTQGARRTHNNASATATTAISDPTSEEDPTREENGTITSATPSTPSTGAATSSTIRGRWDAMSTPAR